LSVWYHRYMKEVWKDVVGYEGRYEVSSLGRLRGPRTTTKGIPGSRGYYQVFLREKGARAGKTKNIHVLVAEAFLGPRPDGMHVCHADGDKSNNTLENLRYDTPKNNWEDFRKNPGKTRHRIGRETCPRNHKLESPNLMKSQLERGWRSCLACSRAAGYLRQNPKLKVSLEELSDKYYQQILEETQ
jgi:hypothetical protein